MYQSHALLLNKIEPEKCVLEIIVTYNLRLRKSLRHVSVSKDRLKHICDFCFNWECVLGIAKPYTNHDLGIVIAT